MAGKLKIRELTSEADLRFALPLVLELRPHLATFERFRELFEIEQREGYCLVGGFAPDDELVSLAGYRSACTLARGPHLFVDDLVTRSTSRGEGYGLAMLEWLRKRARELNLPVVYLDSRDSAIGFYERAGFTFLTSKPCWIGS